MHIFSFSFSLLGGLPAVAGELVQALLAPAIELSDARSENRRRADAARQIVQLQASTFIPGARGCDRKRGRYFFADQARQLTL